MQNKIHSPQATPEVTGRRSAKAAFSDLVEPSSAERVVEANRRSWVFFTAITAGGLPNLVFFAFAADLGVHQDFATLAFWTALGALVLVPLCIATGYVGMRMRVPTAVISKRAFGESGSKVVTAVFVLAMFGWFGVSLEAPVYAINGLLERKYGVTLPPAALIIGSAAVICLIASIGFRALGKATYVAVALLFAMMIWALWEGLSVYGTGPLAQPSLLTPYSGGLILSLIIGGSVTVVATAPDFSRFSRTSVDNVISCVVGPGILMSGALLLIAAVAVLYGTGDVMEIFVRMDVVGIATAVLLLGALTTNEAQLYAAGLSLSVLLPKVQRWKLTALAAAIGTALALAGIFSHLAAFFNLLGVAITPIAGVYLVDFFTRRDEYLKNAPLRTFRPESFFAWLVGSLVGFLTSPPEVMGLNLFSLTTAPTIDAGLTTAAAFIFARMLLENGRKGELLVAGHSSDEG